MLSQASVKLCGVKRRQRTGSELRMEVDVEITANRLASFVNYANINFENGIERR